MASNEFDRPSGGIAQRDSNPHGIGAVLEPSLYRALLEAVHHQMAAGLIVAEAPSGRFVYWNQAAEQLAGHPLSPSESVADYLNLPAHHLDGRPYQLDEYPMARAIRGETVRNEQILYPREDGFAQLSVSALPVPGPDGKPLYGVCTFTDVTEHASRADELQRQREQLQHLERAATLMAGAATVADVVKVAIHESMTALAASSAAINLYDESDRMLKIAGASDDPAGRASLSWGPIPLDAELLVSRAARMRAPQFITTDSDFERTSRQAASTLKSLGVGRAAFCPMYAGDRLVGTIGFSFHEPGAFSAEQVRFMEQLAAQCALAVERARLYEQTERASKAKSDFLAVMSHELRSPLNAVEGHAALLEDGIYGPVNEAQVGAIRRLRRSAKLLLALITDMLDFARIEAGKVTYHIRRHPLQQLLADVDELVRPQLGERRLSWHVGSVPPQATVLADEDRARQVLLNLVTNALKFTSDGGRVELNADVRDGVARICVKDNGIGIPSGRLTSIFDPFVQLDASQKGQRQGIGLGLAISRDLARGMGGELTVESVEGQGSTFTLTLPT